MAKDKIAVIETGGKQYLIKPKDIIRIERIKKPKRGLVRKATAEGDTIHFDKVLLLVNGGEVKIGDPYIKSMKIDGKWMAEEKGKHIVHLKYHSKTRQQTRKGHRQIHAKIAIGEF